MWNGSLSTAFMLDVGHVLISFWYSLAQMGNCGDPEYHNRHHIAQTNILYYWQMSLRDILLFIPI